MIFPSRAAGWALFGVALLAGFPCLSGCSGASHASLAPTGSRIALPPAGKLYHGVYPGGKTGEEDDITATDVRSYQDTVGQKVAWVYFSDNWYRSRAFPLATCTWIRKLGSVPFVRLMLRSSPDEISAAGHHAAPKAQGGPRPAATETVFTLQAIIDGDFDADLTAWAQGAKAFGTPMIVEYGTEVNGAWFPWNGKYAGAGTLNGFGDPTKPDGPERFVAAYRHIVNLMRNAGASNLTWVFHVNWDDTPEAAWNRFTQYYPGGDVVDWLGISGYGYLTSQDDYPPESLRMEMDSAYEELTALAPGKPIMLLEFGCTAGNPQTAPEDWAQAALDDLFANRWPRVRGFSWWNEHWENDDDPADDTTMRVQDTPALAQVFSDTLAAHAAKLQTRPVYGR